MSDQNAASWGYFDCVNHRWNEEILKTAGFPVSLLPEIKTSGDVAGYLADNWHSIPKGTPIGIALGDLQCSVLSTIETNKDAVLNISTSAQIAFIAEDYKPTTGPPSVSTVEYFPYFKNKYLAVAASLNGGNSLATFVKMVQQWTMTLGFSVPQCTTPKSKLTCFVNFFVSAKIWEKVLSLGLEESSVSDLKISPTCLGERHAPNVTASVTNINIGNLELGKVFRALCNGLIVNLHSMMPRDILQNANITRIVGNGSGLSRNKVLQNEVLNLYKLPLVFTTGGDAAKGAAMAMNLDNVSFQ